MIIARIKKTQRTTPSIGKKYSRDVKMEVKLFEGGCMGHRKLERGGVCMLHVIIYFGVLELYCSIKI